MWGPFVIQYNFFFARPASFSLTPRSERHICDDSSAATPPPAFASTQVLGGGRFPSALRDWRMDFEGLKKKKSHWGLEWGSAGALKSLKLQVFLIGDGNGGTGGDALTTFSQTVDFAHIVHVQYE